MITRTIKYTASDGTEHDNPQAAATFDLAQTILQIGGTFTPMQKNMAEKLALSPEALRDAVNAYFEDLEAHPDSPAAQAFDDMVRYGRGVARISPEDLVAPQGDPDDPTTWRADLPVDHPNYCRPFGTRED